MKRRQFISLPLPVLCLTLTSTVLASNTWYADGVNGNDANDCQTALAACKTIGHAISLASSGDSIIVATATYTENLTIGFSLNVIGSSANTTIIDGGSVNRVVTINNGVVTLSDVAIRNGLATLYGGGIYNNGLLTINNSTISQNQAFIPGNELYRYSYGGIYNIGKLTINNSTISGNSATCVRMSCAGFGGGILNVVDSLFINNSSLVGNIAKAKYFFSQGGAIDNLSGIVSISNSTISGNIAVRGAGISGPISAIKNSIAANKSFGGNCYGTVTSNGYNLSGDNSCNFNGAGDLNNTDPKLGAFGVQRRADSDDPFALWQSRDRCGQP